MPAIDELLSRAASSVANPSAAQEDAIARLMALQARLEEGALRVAVLGQFKRGKSTLLNLTASQTRSGYWLLLYSEQRSTDSVASFVRAPRRSAYADWQLSSPHGVRAGLAAPRGL